MSRAEINYLAGLALFVAGSIEAISGFVLWLILPRGSGGGATFIFNRHMWLGLHDWLAIALVAIIVVHLALHWKWIITMTKRVFLNPKPTQGPKPQTQGSE